MGLEKRELRAACLRTRGCTGNFTVIVKSSSGPPLVRTQNRPRSGADLIGHLYLFASVVPMMSGTAIHPAAAHPKIRQRRTCRSSRPERRLMLFKFVFRPFFRSSLICGVIPFERRNALISLYQAPFTGLSHTIPCSRSQSTELRKLPFGYPAGFVNKSRRLPRTASIGRASW